ncbi:type II secretion system F family protein [Hungatella hathewayi]|uniref:type II secretion system F family protein n=1 Tax=Hungatella hathewayi TaxID=154046 RepID=UPI0035619EF5
MIIIAIVLFTLFAILLIYRSMDFTKEGIIERKKRIQNFKIKYRSKIKDPFYDAITSRVSDETRKKVEDKYQKAGFKINYASNITICLLVGTILSLICLLGLHNPYLAIAAFGFGWNIPGLLTTFIANKRLEKINEQVGMFMRMVIKRYQVLKDFYLALETTTEDFVGEEPIYSELITTLNNINRGDPIDDALHEFANRTDNKFLRRFADYYAISSEIGTEEARKNILGQALTQYEEHMELSRELKKQLSELSMEAYLMLLFVPAVIVYQCMNDASYIPFMTTTMLGKVGSAVILAVWLICLWVINTKLAAPVDQENES